MRILKFIFRKLLIIRHFTPFGFVVNCWQGLTDRSQSSDSPKKRRFFLIFLKEKRYLCKKKNKHKS